MIVLEENLLPRVYASYKPVPVPYTRIKITHRLGIISDPVFHQTWEAYTTKTVSRGLFHREGCTGASLVVFSTPSPLHRRIARRTQSALPVVADASLVVLSTPSPLARIPALKIVRGGVLSDHTEWYRNCSLVCGTQPTRKSRA